MTEKLQQFEEQSNDTEAVEEGRQVLNKLLTRIPHQQEKEKIADIVRFSQFDSIDSEFSESWKIILEGTDKESLKVKKVLEEKVTHKLMIDLGGGREMMRESLGLQDIIPGYYINVDKFYFRGDDGLNQKTPQGFSYGVSSDVWQSERRIKRLEVDAEMLTFLQYVQDGSIEVLSLNGIDVAVAFGEGYHEELIQQIYRVLSQGGILIQSGSKAIELLAEDGSFGDKWEIKFSGARGMMQILEKK